MKKRKVIENIAKGVAVSAGIVSVSAICAAIARAKDEYDREAYIHNILTGLNGSARSRDVFTMTKDGFKYIKGDINRWLE